MTRGLAGLVIVLLGVASAACSVSDEPARAEAPSPPQVPESITGASEKLAVTGRIEPVSLPSVDSLGIDAGRLVVRGPASSVNVDVPAGADVSKPSRDWALTTEGASENGRRRFTFVHGVSLDDFTIELPPGGAPLKFGVLEGQAGASVMIFAWGEASRSYWGYVTITRKAE